MDNITKAISLSNINLPSSPKDFIGKVKINYVEKSGDIPAVHDKPYCEHLTTECDNNHIILKGYYDLDNNELCRVGLGSNEYGIDIIVYSLNRNVLISDRIIWRSREYTINKSLPYL